MTALPLPNPDEIESRLITLGQRIGAETPSALRHAEQAKMPEWSGADVRVTSDFLFEPKDFMEAHNLLVRTCHAVALTWLILEVRDVFGAWVNRTNKSGFYGALGQAALRHLAAHAPEPEEPRPLLLAVLAEAFCWQRVLREEGMIPAEAAIVLHTRDAEGRQGRREG